MEEPIRLFFEKFNKEVQIVDIMHKFDRETQKNSGTQRSYSCMWHSDSNPSFFVNTENNVFRCFGCERSGGPYTLIKLWLISQDLSATPQSVVAFSGVDFTFPNMRHGSEADLDKKKNFKKSLKATPEVKLPSNKGVAITQIMMGFSDDKSLSEDLWGDIFNESIL